MLKFILDTLHITGLFCDIWPEQKAFESTDCSYVAMGSSRFDTHSWMIKKCISRRLLTISTVCPLCIFDLVCPDQTHCFFLPLPKTKRAKQTKMENKLLFFPLFSSLRMVSLFTQSLPQDIWEPCLTPPSHCLYSAHHHVLLILPRKQIKFDLFLHQHQSSSSSPLSSFTAKAS